MFAVDEAGVISAQPEQVIFREAFCRLENVHCLNSTCAIADTINGVVLLYDIAADPELQRPVREIREGLTLPHGVKFSPDGNTLVVSNYGLRSWRQEILWHGWNNPRSDSVAIYQRDGSALP